MIELGEDEMWTPFLEEVNNLLIDEKQYRHENDHVKQAEVCTRIVSEINQICIIDKNLVILIDSTLLRQ